MHRAIAAWLTEHPGRAAFASAICGALSPYFVPLFIVLAGAVVSLATLQYHLQIAVIVAAAGAFTATMVMLSMYEPSVWLYLGIGLLSYGPLLLALLLKRTGSLNLAFQVAVLSIAACLIVVHVSLEDPVAIWTGLLHTMVDAMLQAGLSPDADADVIVANLARTMWGALAAIVLATTLGALFLGRWWSSLGGSAGSFGEEYRQLRLGKVLGLAVSVLLLVAMFVDAPLLASLVWVSFMALALQGLAAAHRSKARGRINRGWLAAIYVLLVVPLSTSVTVFVLAIWGFADNWTRPRAQQV